MGAALDERRVNGRAIRGTRRSDARWAQTRKRLAVKEEQLRCSNVLEPLLDLSRRDIDDELGDLGRAA
jgi:hypothetical protein